MKFYYKDKLVRTSKTHEYRYAIVKRADIESNAEKIKPFACSKDMRGIESNLAYLSKELRCYKAVKAGTYVKKPHCYSSKELEKRMVEFYGSVDAAIEAKQAGFDQWIVVELEAKE